MNCSSCRQFLHRPAG
ncbi:MAG: hypothetical protein H7Y31_03340 [Chitinophagaceae bacterium]|nr:hypothetical protein [Chitinophagaceae bacterium]